MARLEIFRPNGGRETKVVSKLNLGDLYEIVGCELVKRIRVRFEGRIRDCYVDEDGLLKPEPQANRRITEMLDAALKGYQVTICGTAVVWVPK